MSASPHGRASTPARAHRSGRLRRRLTWPALVGAFAAVIVSASPGMASAVTPTVTPLLDCYAQNSDGSWTAVLGYTSTYATTRSFPIGTTNTFNPTALNGPQPTSYLTGTRHAAFTVRVTPAQVSAGVTWTLDGHVLNYAAAAYASGICTPQQLPALGNGALMAGVLLAAGVVGYVMIRRIRRRAAAVPGA
jgi:hypothetical protein